MLVLVIDTREELIGALHEAAEIEHGLMIQYLFPALTMKKWTTEGIDARQQAMLRRWEGIVLKVAVEEMGHLGTVFNLLAAVGAGPHLARPNFPQHTGYYPFAFDLVPFGDEALYRMLVFELPRGEPLPPPPGAHLETLALAPDPLEYTFVGELYEQIRSGFAAIDEAALFIGPTAAQVPDAGWSQPLDMRRVRNRAEAFAAIDDIIVDGEGAAPDRAGSHYARFRAVRAEHHAAGSFDGARAVVRNPRTRNLRDAGAGTLLEGEAARAAAELFNGAYATMLTMLAHFFVLGAEPGDPTDAAAAPRRAALRAATSRMMSTALRPIAEVLTELPAGDPADPRRAGPPFELYDAVDLSPQPSARWTILLEDLATVAAGAIELSDATPRFAAIGETIGFVRRALAEVAP